MGHTSIPQPAYIYIKCWFSFHVIVSMSPISFWYFLALSLGKLRKDIFIQIGFIPGTWLVWKQDVYLLRDFGGRGVSWHSFILAQDICGLHGAATHFCLESNWELNLSGSLFGSLFRCFTSLQSPSHSDPFQYASKVKWQPINFFIREFCEH